MTSKEFYNTPAWRWFSRTMLLYYAKEYQGELWVQCCTSGRWYKPNDRNIHLGHYKKVFDGNSTNFATAFHELNVAPQRSADNTYAGGKPEVMREWLIKKHGEKLIEKVEIQSKNFCKLDKVKLAAISEKYKEKFKKLAKEKGNPWK